MEQELLELWSSVEKDKDARRQLAHATLLARQAQRARARLPKQVPALVAASGVTCLNVMGRRRSTSRLRPECALQGQHWHPELRMQAGIL